MKLTVQYLKDLHVEEDTKANETIISIWDFAGQHMYYTSHSVFLSHRALYILVHNLRKDLNAKAEPCARQGIHGSSISIIVNGSVLKLPPKLRKLVHYSFFCFLFFLI